MLHYIKLFLFILILHCYYIIVILIIKQCYGPAALTDNQKDI